MITTGIIFLFEYKHLNRGEQIIARPFYVLANVMEASLPFNDARENGLKALLYAKDQALKSFNETAYGQREVS